MPIILNFYIFAKIFNLKKLKMNHIIKVVCYLLMCEFNLCSCLLFLFSGMLLQEIISFGSKTHDDNNY